eukprot:3938043-Rhodomonas_salina.1
MEPPAPAPRLPQKGGLSSSNATNFAEDEPNAKRVKIESLCILSNNLTRRFATSFGGVPEGSGSIGVAVSAKPSLPKKEREEIEARMEYLEGIIHESQAQDVYSMEEVQSLGDRLNGRSN